MADFKLYRLKNVPELRQKYALVSLRALQTMGMTPKKEHYECVYSGQVIDGALSPRDYLQYVYKNCSGQHPGDFCLAVGDVVDVNFGDRKAAYYYDDSGFNAIRDFDIYAHEFPENASGRALSGGAFPATSVSDKAESLVSRRRKELVGKVISMMETGWFNNQAEWDRTAFSPQNPISGAVYKGGNRLRLMIAAMDNGYTDPRWATFKQYSAKGYKIKKGAHGVSLEKWVFTRTRAVKDEHGHIKKDAEGNIIKEIVPLEHPQCNFFTVFNAGQVEGFPTMKRQPPPAEPEIFDIIDQVMQTSECPINIEKQGRAFYSPKLDTITIPPFAVFKDMESFAKTLLHEMAHSTGHKSRLNRKLDGGFGSEDYAKEELRAELGALFTESDLGIRLIAEHYEDHSDYLKSWIGVLKNDYNELFRACRDAEAISERLVGNYMKRYEMEQPEIRETESGKTQDALLQEKEDIHKRECPHVLG